MSGRDNQQQAATPVTPIEQPLYRDPWLWIVAAGAVALVCFCAYKFWPITDADSNRPDVVQAPGPMEGPKKPQEPDDFLSEFNREDSEPGKGADAAAPSSRKLEAQFDALQAVSDRLGDLKKRGADAGDNADDDLLREARAAQKEFDRQAAELETALKKARQARPTDAVPRWLTGELLILVGGEPEEILPHLEFAAAHGLSRPHLAASMARVQLQSNRFADSYRTAAAGLSQFGQDRHLWDAFARAAIHDNRFEPVLDRLANSFPAGLPAWAKAYRFQAEALQAKWQEELAIRRAEARADDLPRVRLTIEHRRFARDLAGNPLTAVESTGRGEIVLELFENEAPQTVANFIDLVSRRFYDGTSFHLVLPATSAVGGDPNTKNDDPDDDGKGGPGYAIADESRAKNARRHFRGSISMVKNEAGIGSQFYLSLAPAPEMDGHFTVFGRILEGQETADRITRGRTTRSLRYFGRIIPGDLLVRAEVLRKRPHEYRAVKVQP